MRAGRDVACMGFQAVAGRCRQGIGVEAAVAGFAVV